MSEFDEFAEALAEALAVGGADGEEIREAILGARVDDAVPDRRRWRLDRHR
ncbi:hypothetical protein [Sinosporangium album]|uniref:hypothetical protein n=1 Tax=Sinosporangium album TaxID=504805 RepID=UPI0015A343F5|nr:hypothetical protein [Sinosporangium album]